MTHKFPIMVSRRIIKMEKQTYNKLVEALRNAIHEMGDEIIDIDYDVLANIAIDIIKKDMSGYE